MKIKVTKSDIKNGVTGHCAKCPVALAIRRALRTKDYIVVVIDAVRLGKKYGYQAFPLTERVRRFITHFDLGDPVEPFTFNLRLR